MKLEFKAKFLNHLLKKKDGEGFTLIELLVVIIIIGILSAIALPSFLNQAAKAKQSEAKQSVGATVRAQQAYRIEDNFFATNFEALEIGIPTSTENYSYSILDSNAQTTVVLAQPVDTTALKGVSGGVVVMTTTGQTAVATCITESVGLASAPALDPAGTVANAAANCTGTSGLENMD